MFGPISWQPTIAEDIEAWHSQADLSREWMGEPMVNEFDVELEAMLTRMFLDGRCQIEIFFTVAWGTPSSPASS